MAVLFRKTIFANTIEAAMSAARKELGDEALLLESRASRKDECHKGAYALEFEVAHTTATAAPPGRTPDPPPSRTVTAHGDDLAAMRNEVANLSLLVTRLAARVSGFHYSAELSSVAGRLLASGIPEALALNILDSVEQRLGVVSRTGAVPEVQAHRALAVELESRLAVNSELYSPGQPRKVIGFVGPAGAGKTTTLVKVAMRFGVAARKPTLIVSTDNNRIAATEQLKAYAAILGLPFLLVGGPGALETVLLEHRHKELVLIDSPGFGEADGEAAEECALLLAEAQPLETHLVLSATTRVSDMESAIRRWDRFHPRNLILTHLDDADTYGECLGAAMKHRLPISFLCGGQKIPEDLEPATKGKLLQLLLGAQAASFAAVA
jgi:flagellar biosynthesis protein FlhF